MSLRCSGLISSAKKPRISASCGSGTGKGEEPHCPVTSVVMPCEILLSANTCGSRPMKRSLCEWLSMSPGVSVSPAASITARASSRVWNVILPFSMPTSPTKAGAPVPSTMRALRMMKSSMFVNLPQVSHLPSLRKPDSMTLRLAA